MKKCSKCGVVKALSEFFKRNDRPCGVQPKCKQCQTILARTWDAAHREYLAEKLRIARAADPERFKKYGAEWRRLNPERLKANKKRSYNRPEVKRNALATAKKWRIENKERDDENHARWRTNNPERLSVLTARANKKWRASHPAVLRELEAARKRAKHANLPWAEKDKMLVVYQKAREWGMEVDHIVPLKNELVCGLHVWHNLQLLDRNLNRAKRNHSWPDMP